MICHGSELGAKDGWGQAHAYCDRRLRGALSYFHLALVSTPYPNGGDDFCLRLAGAPSGWVMGPTESLQ